MRYELRASASVYWRGEKRLVTERKVIDVVEGLNDVALTEYVNGAHATSITVGENGKLSMQGSIIGGGIITAGESACVELQVKNHSSKKVQTRHFRRSTGPLHFIERRPDIDPYSAISFTKRFLSREAAAADFGYVNSCGFSWPRVHHPSRS